MGAVPNYLSVLLGMWERKGWEKEVHSITTLQSFAPNPQIGPLPHPPLFSYLGHCG